MANGEKTPGHNRWTRWTAGTLGCLAVAAMTIGSVLPQSEGERNFDPTRPDGDDNSQIGELYVVPQSDLVDLGEET